MQRTASLAEDATLAGHEFRGSREELRRARMRLHRIVID
jgi:hypothetical protein